jgi:hypothetical protein
MKLPITAIAAFTVATGLAQAADARFLVFHTSHAAVRAKGECPVPTLDLQELATKDAAVLEARRLNNMPGQSNHQVSVLEPGRYHLVYEYLSQSAMYPGCQFKKFAVIDGEDEHDARRRLDLRVAEFRTAYLSAPAIRQVWTGGQLTRIRRDYDGVVIDFRSRKDSDDTATVHAQVRNTHNDKAALVVFEINGTFQDRGIVVDPGGTANVPLGRGVRSFAAAVHFAAPAAAKPPGWLDIAKQKLREKVTIRRGQMQDAETDQPCMCIRG